MKQTVDVSLSVIKEMVADNKSNKEIAQFYKIPISQVANILKTHSIRRNKERVHVNLIIEDTITVNPIAESSIIMNEEIPQTTLVEQLSDNEL